MSKEIRTNGNFDKNIGISEAYLLTKHPCSWCTKLVDLKEGLPKGTAFLTTIIALENGRNFLS